MAKRTMVGMGTGLAIAFGGASAEERRRAILPDYRLRPGAELGYPLLIQKGKALAASGVAFRDLTQIYRDVAEPVYRDECCHVNLRGNRILARAMAESDEFSGYVERLEALAQEATPDFDATDAAAELISEVEDFLKEN